ncbi:MAG: Crp/Fnr family transcriptional regulator [Bacteroidales bacterium]|nr:MAG: Crp/Fnr family transcriptional regulator [Bacteroidales bacterium]
MESPTVNPNDMSDIANPLSHSLSDSELNLLNMNCNLVEYAQRDTIIKQNSRASHIIFINSGLVKISKEMRKGKNLMLNIEGANKFIGSSSVFGSDYYNYSVTALEPTVVSFIDSKIFKEIIAKNGALGLELIAQISRDNILMTEKLSSLLYKQLPGRVADIIIYFSETIYKSETFTFPLTRQELAELAGTTKESIIRTLSEFKHDKIISIERNTISILSPKIIQTLSRLG